MLPAVQSMVADFRKALEEVRADHLADKTGRLKVPVPEKYDGKRDEDALREFLRSLAYYFANDARISEGDYPKLAGGFLKGLAALWYDANETTLRAGSWENFKEKITAQFVPLELQGRYERELNAWKLGKKATQSIQRFHELTNRIGNVSDGEKRRVLLAGLPVAYKQHLLLVPRTNRATQLEWTEVLQAVTELAYLKDGLETPEPSQSGPQASVPMELDNLSIPAKKQLAKDAQKAHDKSKSDKSGKKKWDKPWPKLPRDEFQRRMAEELCLKCASPDHMFSDCQA